MDFLSDAEVFGTQVPKNPAPIAAQTPQPNQFLSDEDVFGTPTQAQAAQVPAVAKTQAQAQPDQSDQAADTIPRAERYVLEGGKNVAQGAEAMAGQALKGTAEVMRGFDKRQLDFMNSIDQGNEPTLKRGESWYTVDPYGYRDMSPEQRQVFRAANQSTMEAPVPSRGLYQAGSAVEKFGQQPGGALANFPGWETGLYHDIGTGAGALVTGIGTSLIPGVGPAVGPTLFLTSGADQQYQDALRSGATEDQALRAAQLGTVAGASGMADLLLPMVGTPGKALGLIQRVGLRALKGAFIGGGQAGLQQFVSNVIAKNIYAPARDVSQDVGYNSLVGAILGGGTSAALGHGPELPPASQDQIREAYGQEPPTPPPAAKPAERPQDSTGTPTQPAIEVPPASPEVLDQMTRDGIFLSPDETQGTTVTPQIPEDQGLAVPPSTMNPDVVDFLNSKSAPIRADMLNDEEMARGAEPPPVGGPEDYGMPLGQDVATNPGVNAGRLARLLGPKLYGEPSEMAPVTVKEMFQNAFDAVKASLEAGTTKKGKIDVEMNPNSREILIRDNGEGMPTSVMGKEFLEIAGTKKSGSRPSGGLGIAKMLILYGNKNMRVVSLRDGKVSELNTTGEQLFSALEDKSKAPTINVRDPTAADRKMFPDGHGTVVKVEVPQSYNDPSTGEQKPIDFRAYDFYHPVLQHSPLFDNIDVTFNNRPVKGMGNSFPYDDYTNFANVNFDWGQARVYASKGEGQGEYSPNAHVLSNGLWQFSFEVKEDPGKSYGKNINKRFYIDVNPKVSPEEPGYPFDLNRQNFSKTVQDDFGKIFNYMSLVYQRAQIEKSMRNFGDMQYLTYDPKTRGVVVGDRQKIEPSQPPTPTVLNQIKPGDTVNVVDGKLVVNGRQIPELTKEDLEKFRIDPGSLKVPQEQINPRQMILHDNMEIRLSPIEQKSFVNYARERHGGRFDEFVFHVGNAFRELRDIVAQVMKEPPMDVVGGGLDEETRKSLEIEHRERHSYKDLRTEGVGVSFDPQYRGVSIVVPFRGLFVNPILTEYTDPVRAGVGVVGTMIHEIAHHKVRSHNADFPAEMQRILINLDSNTVGFNLHAFKQKVVNVYNSYSDVFNGLRNDVVSGNFDIQPRGERFKDPSAQSTGTGLASHDVATTGSGAEPGPGLREWVTRSAATSEDELQRSQPIGQVAGGPPNLDPIRSAADNARAFAAVGNAGTIPAGIQPETQIVREVARKALGGETPPEVLEAGAHADRMNRFYKWFAGLDQLVRSNKRFTPLLRYAERVREMHNDESKIHDAALRVSKEWRSLGKQGENLTAFIDDMANMRYRSDEETKRGINRQPTKNEFEALVRKHGLSDDALKTYTKIRTMFNTFLDLVTQNSIDQATRIMQTDPVRLSAKIDEINAQRDALKQTPYFPFMSFGRHYVRANDAKGHALYFETFERQGLQSAEKQQLRRYNDLVKQHGADKVSYGLLPEAALPMIGMPNMLLADIKNDPHISLSDAQKNALDMLVFTRTAQGSFATRFKNKNYVPGYSMDFKRAFARYFFHGARYYSRQKYLWQLKDAISQAQNARGNKANSIADYMRDHLQNTILDYTGDFGTLKGAIFLWALGYVPAAATQNLTQTPMITLPFLSAKFGDIAASREMVSAMSKLSSYYRRGRYDNMSDFEARALSYGIKTGRLSETQAPELAGMSQGANLLQGMGGNRAQRGWLQFQEKAAWMFEMAEQFNRRVAYRAALNLAMKNPNAKFVQESKNMFADEYAKLVAEYGPQGAAAVVSAANAVDNTQYVYARYARPRVMRGKLPGTLFVFKKYMQSTLFMLAQNKSDVLPRYLLVTAAMGGLAGLPGYDDFKSLLQATGAWLFKSHFNLDQEIRKYALQFSNGTVEPDFVLHGLARRGFGLPGLVDLLGERPGRGLSATHSQNVPFPIIDRSRAIGMGNILPVDIGKMMTPTNDVNKEIADETQQASGAVFSVGFNLYKALQDTKNDWNDFKRWERVMPRALSSASRSYRAFTENRERAKGGVASSPTIVNYDPRDTEQMMEALALAGGYQPLRLQSKWDTIMAKQEVEQYYNMQRDALMQQLFEAHFGKDPKEIQDVQESIRRFNTELPDWARGRAITADSAMKSMQTRARDRMLRNAGAPLQKSNTTIDRYIETLFPEAKTIEIKPAR